MIFVASSSVRRLDYLHQIAFAGGEKELLDLAATFFGQVPAPPARV
jgi:hypothetical protein